MGNTVLLVLVALLLGAFLLSPQDRVPGAGQFEIVGKPAPDFALYGPQGIWRLRDHLGKPLVISFWTTWCGACRKDLDILEEFNRRFGDRFTVVGICPEHWEKVPEILREHPVSFPILHDPGERVTRAYERLDHTRYPFTVFVGEDGRVRCVWAYAFSDLEGFLGILARCGFGNGVSPSLPSRR